MEGEPTNQKRGVVDYLSMCWEGGRVVLPRVVLVVLKKGTVQFLWEDLFYFIFTYDWGTDKYLN